MKSSKLARREAKGLFRASMVNGVMDENRVREAFRLVIAQKPRGYAGILSHLERLVKLEVVRRSAHVESPVELDAEMKAKLQASLTKTYGPGLTMTFGSNPALLGGLRIKVGSDVYDGSVLARLNALQESF